MGYTPTDIEVDYSGLNWTVSFSLNRRHEIRFNRGFVNYRLYVDGAEIKHGEDPECRFTIEGVDCYFSLLGFLGPKLEIGGVKVKISNFR